jgi:diguanylate cyclase (GGDEF)-like protein/PAS domain S-box-containing protein
MARVLVIDDEPDNRSLIVTLLGYAGHEAFEARDGVEGLAITLAQRPDLVICDILMPSMDGYEFVRRLRGEPEIAQTEVIFWTATYLEREARNLAQACGVQTVLTKPTEPQIILDSVAQALVHAVNAAPGRPPAPAQPDAGPFSEAHLRVVSDKLLVKVSELEAANQRLSALTELGLLLASEHDPHILLDKLCRGARELLGARSAVLCVKDADDAGLFHRSCWGLEPTQARLAMQVPFDVPLATQVLDQRRAQRFEVLDEHAGLIDAGGGLPPMRSGLIVPVASLEHVHGWLLVIDKLGAAGFSADDESLLVTHAAQAGRIYENGSLYQRVQRHVAQLRQSEARLAGLIESAMDAIVAVDEALAIVLFNPAASRMFGYSADEMLGQRLDCLLPDKHRGAHDGDIRNFSQGGGRPRPMGSSRTSMRTVAGLRRNGEAFPIDASISMIAVDGQHLYVAILRDITARVQADEHIRRLARVATVLSDINSLIVRVRDRQELLNEACRIAVEQGHFRRAWIAVIDDAHLHMSACIGPDDGYFDQLRREFAQVRLGSDSRFFTALQTQQPVVFNDLAQMTELPFREEVLAGGSRSLVWLPLMVSGQCVALLSLHADTAGFFDADEMKLLRELAGDMSFALEHIAQQERLVHLAYYDLLTGLANSTLFHERLERHLDAAALVRQKVAIALVDLVRFKMINDTLGRHAGDALLQRVAERLLDCVGDHAQIARISADRYAVVFADVRAEAELARVFAGQYAQCFGQPYAIDSQDLLVSAKVGIALYPEDGGNAETLFRNAEAAVKNAKAGADTVLFYNPRMSATVAETLAMENRLRLALERDEFVLHYQPKVDLDSRRMVSVEALLRWHSPDLGLVQPLKFIALLEETGQILAVGDWALRCAARDHRHWRELGLVAPRIAVNVSAIQLHRDDFVASLAAALHDEGAQPAGIDIEITETIVMQDVEASVAKLHALRSMGVDVAIDDFGTGYSSLAYLSRLPVQLLKIDRAFVDTMLTDPNNMILVSTMISLAHSLRMKVIAEGVETEEQAKILQLLRCDQMQGYLVSRPVPREQITAMLQAAA